VQTGYDSYLRPVTQSLVSGGTTYALTQTSYDGLGRVQCTAQRMNPSVYGALPSDACTLGTTGSYGADRIVKQTYDNVGRVTLVQTGYGASGVEADEVTTAYTTNGKVASVTTRRTTRPATSMTATTGCHRRNIPLRPRALGPATARITSS